jgi:drug/metabolite transporter (DMT)-like permease
VTQPPETTIPPERWLTRPAPIRRNAVILGVLVTFLWATSVVLIRIGVNDEAVDPLGFAGVRFALAAILLLPLALPRMRAAGNWRGSRRWLLGVAVYGLAMFCVAQVGFYVALGELTAATVGLFMGLTPVVAAVVALRSHHERASWLQLVGIGVLVAGVVVYFGLELPTEGTAVGLVTAASIPIVVGGSAMLGRRVAVDSEHHGGPISMTAIAMIVGSLATLALALVIEGVPSFSPTAWLLILWLAAVNTAFAYTLWAQSQRTLRAVESSVLGDLTVMLVALLGWVVLGEGLGLTQILGIALALAGVVVVQVAPVLKRPAHAEPGPADSA